MTSLCTHAFSKSTRRVIVYLASNLIEAWRGRVYVGVTEKTLPGRRHRHHYAARHGSNTRFHRALRKYGEQSFHWQILDVQPDYFSGLRSEAQIIASLKGAYDLYNMTDGGGGIKGYRMSPEARAKMSAAKKGRPGPKASAETRALLSLIQAGKKKPPLSAQTKARLRINAQKANAARRRQILCVTDGKQYPSLTEAAKAYGLPINTIGNRARCGGRGLIGLEFRYVK